MGMKLEAESKHFMKQLGKTAGMLQVVAAETLNESGQNINQNYKRKLKKNTIIRTKFTSNASKTFKSQPFRRSGEPRPIGSINTMVAVRKMKGGKEHYLKKLEEGNTQRGSVLTRGKVPVPLNTARTGGKYGKSVGKPNRLDIKPQVLKAGGVPIGIKGDRRKNGKAWVNPQQRFKALYRYKKGQVKKPNLQGDLTKPFFFIDNKNQLGVFKLVRNRVRKIRKLEKARVRHKGEPHFERSFRNYSKKEIQKLFVKKAKARF